MLGAHSGALGVSELARTTGLSKAVVHRILQTLVESGLAAYEASTRRYRLGPAAVTLGRRAERGDPLSRAAMPVLAHLADSTGETAVLSARWGHRRVYLGQVESRQPIRITITLGEDLPLWIGASGLAILAFMPPRDVDLVLSAPLRRFTDRTEVDPAAIRARLEQVRDQGYAHSAGERVHHSSSISAPVLDAEGLPAGCLSVAFLDTRLPDERIDQYAQQVLAAAASATEELRLLS